MAIHRPTVTIVGLGNPMLDITTVTDLKFIQKHNLDPNGAKHVENEHIFMEIEKDHDGAVYTAGGSVDNTCRVAQRILGNRGGVGYIGCIGNDKNGKVLENAMQSAGVTTYYQKSNDFPTGRCMVLITEKINRCLVTYPGAANKLSINNILSDENWCIIQKAKIIYSGAFFLACSAASLLKVAQFCSNQEDKRFCFNLSASFLCRPPHVEKIKKLIQFADIVVGNTEENETFAEFGLGLDSKDITNHTLVARSILELPKIGKYRKTRSVIITRGKYPCIFADGNNGGIVREYATVAVKESDIVDTNGAGDAFVGGLLASMAINISYGLNITDDTIASGLKASSQILRVSGCRDDLFQNA